MLFMVVEHFRTRTPELFTAASARRDGNALRAVLRR